VRSRVMYVTVFVSDQDRAQAHWLLREGPANSKRL
jgi:hypothetical protein